MTKQRIAQVLTIAILAVALVLAVGRNKGWSLSSVRAAVPAADDSAPQDAVYAMLDAARQGKVDAYLASFGGAQEARLRQSIAESSAASFSKYLAGMNSAVKGVAVTTPEALAPNQVKVRVEYVYQDRSETQIMRLEKRGAGWKIVDVSSSDRIQIVVPYGTPVEDQ